MPAPIPNGTPITLAMPRMNIDPTMALAMPPPASPTGFGVCVRKAQLIDPTPRINQVAENANNGSEHQNDGQDRSARHHVIGDATPPD